MQKLSMTLIRFTVLIILGVSFLSSCSQTDYSSSGDVGYPGYDNEREYMEEYNDYGENPFVKTSEQAASTFSTDVDGASYANVRRIFFDGSQPDPAAVRIEEFLNYFPFDYGMDNGDQNLGLNTEVTTCPWNTEHYLLRIGLQGRQVDSNNLPGSNIVFLVDVSGSMEEELPLAKQVLKVFVEQLDEKDRISIVTYANSDKVLLSPTSGADHSTIKTAINNLSSGGGTAGGAGITSAYNLAEENFIANGNNRIVLITDGDFNIGVSSQNDLIQLIQTKRDKGIYITVVGMGKGNYKGGTMEEISNKGDGTFEYMDSYEQGRKIFIEEYSKLYTIAKDAKAKVLFNANTVAEYRLIGYENRGISREQFDQDTTDAGEIGINQSMTAIYEVVPVDTSKRLTGEIASLEVRYKTPIEFSNRYLRHDVVSEGIAFKDASTNMHFAAAVTGLGLILKDSEYKGTLSIADVREWTNMSLLFDPYGYRKEMLEIIDLVER